MVGKPETGDETGFEDISPLKSDLGSWLSSPKPDSANRLSGVVSGLWKTAKSCHLKFPGLVNRDDRALKQIFRSQFRLTFPRHPVFLGSCFNRRSYFAR